MSAVLHGAALAAVVLLQQPDRPGAPAEGSVALIWQEQAGEAPGPPAAPSVPSPPERMPADAPPPVPPPDPSLPEAPQQPAEAPPVPPPDPLPPEAPQQVAEALPLPPPRPPPPPAETQPRPAATARHAEAPAQPPAGTPRAPPLTLGGGQVLGPVTPPGPADGIHNPQPEYPFASRMRGEEGVVSVLLHISAAGLVEDIEVLRGSGHAALDAAAEQAVRRWRFRPAMQAGLAVPGRIRTSIQFRLSQ